MKPDEECAVLLQKKFIPGILPCLWYFFLQKHTFVWKSDKSIARVDLNSEREIDCSNKQRGACEGAHRINLKHQKSDHQTETQISV